MTNEMRAVKKLLRTANLNALEELFILAQVATDKDIVWAAKAIDAVRTFHFTELEKKEQEQINHA